MTDYKTLCEQLKAITEGIPYPIANLSNAAALLWYGMEKINWAGFYLAEGGKLILGPFQGKHACILIPFGKGVCGTAAIKGETILVPDVHEFPGHIACDSASESEIVIPLRKNGELFGVLDIDSPVKERFDTEDQKGLEAFAALIEAVI